MKLLNILFLISCFLISTPSFATEPETPTIIDLAEKKESDLKAIEALAAEKVEGPYDEFNRSTPRSSLLGLAAALKEKDFDKALNYLDLRNLTFSINKRQEITDTDDLMEKISIVARRAIHIDYEDLSDEPHGHKNDGLPAYRDRITTIETKNGSVDILLQRVPRGDGQFIWKISNATISKIPELNNEFGYGLIGELLSQFFPSYVIGGFEIWQIIMLLGLLAIGYSIAFIITFLIIKILNRNQNFDKKRLKKFIVGPMRLLITVIFLRSTFDMISPSIIARALFETNTILIISLAWVSSGIIDFIMFRLADRMKYNGQKDAAVLLKPAATTLKLIIFTIAILSWLDNLGFQVTALLAGLGVGGLAVALAAQKSLENLIGSIIIYTSHPVRVGDFCKFGTTLGTVEEIGLRATQLRTLARSVVHIPNALFASGKIENLTQRDKILYRTCLRLAYSDTPEQIKLVLSKIRELIQSHEFIDEENSRVRFLEFGEYAQELELYVYIKTQIFSEYLECREDINLKINEIIASVGAQLVVPKKTIDLHQTNDTLSINS